MTGGVENSSGAFQNLSALRLKYQVGKFSPLELPVLSQAVNQTRCVKVHLKTSEPHSIYFSILQFQKKDACSHC